MFMLLFLHDYMSIVFCGPPNVANIRIAAREKEKLNIAVGDGAKYFMCFKGKANI